MRNLIVGIVVGVVVGIVVGTTVVAPRLKLPVQETAGHAGMASSTQPSAIGVRGAPRQPQAERPPVRAAGAPRPDPLPKRPDRLRWRMASAYASTLAELGRLGKRVEAEIWKTSAGRLQIEFFEPGTLVSTDAALDAVRSGAIEAAFATPSLWAKRNPALHLFSAVPFGPPIQEYLSWIETEGGEIMQDVFADLGVRALPCGLLAPEGSGWFRTPVHSLDQLKSLRVGMTGLGGEVLRQIGVEVMPIAEGDVFVALERGMIDAAEAAQPSIDLRLELHRMARHYYFPGWHQPATLLTLIVNQGAWEALPASEQGQLAAICGDNVRRGLAESEAAQFQALKVLTADGVAIETWPPEIIAALEEAWAEVVAAKRKDSGDFDRAWQSLTRFREEYEIWREIGEPNNLPAAKPISGR